ncbi:T9SS type A sorting domain-containing protein [Flavobacterium aquicola]|uniref:Putative secreted protein (Por secretion system target) n=1 Tax=Flavobacterium aquicola TaxID=1682742 RepID=A0A3E0EID8_9FLAO|nr:T9SS type A sorting domain-containing protein [Flavobacterium aquicola]REG97915.1 putative secreted protein (Por secretion system target) [Flavobacterium aquicola]
MNRILLFIALVVFINQDAFSITPPPSALPQSFCDHATVSNLVANGTSLQWYEKVTGGNALSSSFQLATATYYVTQTIDNEESVRVAVEVTINQAPLIDELGVVYGCSSYTLPALSVGNYYGNDNQTDPFFAGDVIEADRTMYIYGENECGSAQSPFFIIIESALSLPVNESVVVCDSYILPDFSEGGYYTESGGNGTMYNGGDEITMSQILYKHTTNSCGSAETVLDITINYGPYVDFLDDVHTCESYTLPHLSSGNFYTQPNTAGDILYPGDLITSSQVIYLYAGNGCGEAQGSFYVEISELDKTVSLEENTFTASQIDASYEWWDCNAEAFVAGENGQSFSPQTPGLYSVFITYGDCSIWSDCMLSNSLSAEDLKFEKVSIYPNPVSSILNVVHKQSDKIEKIVILDVSGKIIMQQSEKINLVNLERLGSGMYVLKAFSNGSTQTHKFIKE